MVRDSRAMASEPPPGTSEKIEQGTSMVRDSRAMACETERIGDQILNDLSKQRETIRSAQNNMRTVSMELDQSEGSMKELEKPAYQRAAEECCVM